MLIGAWEDGAAFDAAPPALPASSDAPPLACAAAGLRRDAAGDAGTHETAVHWVDDGATDSRRGAPPQWAAPEAIRAARAAGSELEPEDIVATWDAFEREGGRVEIARWRVHPERSFQRRRTGT